MGYSPTRRASYPSRLLSLVCKIPIPWLGLSETNTIGYYTLGTCRGALSKLARRDTDALCQHERQRVAPHHPADSNPAGSGHGSALLGEGHLSREVAHHCGSCGVRIRMYAARGRRRRSLSCSHQEHGQRYLPLEERSPRPAPRTAQRVGPILSSSHPSLPPTKDLASRHTAGIPW